MEAALGEQQSLPHASLSYGDEPDDDLVITGPVPRHDLANEPSQPIIDARNAAFFAPRGPLKSVALTFREIASRLFLPGRKHADTEACPQAEV